MSGGISTTTFVVAGLGLIALAAIIRLVVSWRRHKQHSARLQDAFERAREVGRSGSGIQGKPYSVYGETSWQDDSRSSR